MITYQLQWRDHTEGTDPRVETRDDGVHTYTFQSDNEQNAQAVVQTFEVLNPEHDFSTAKLTTIEETN